MRGPTVWLVGMMGAGKSAVGAALADRLGRPFEDTDARIEAREGRSIPAIFAEDGEGAFRKRERETVLGLSGSSSVVALGGGAVAQPGMRALLAEGGVVVWLRATPETLLARVGQGEGRPLLRGLDEAGRRERLSALLAEREAHYGSADLIVDTDGRSVEEVAEAVLFGLGDEA